MTEPEWTKGANLAQMLALLAPRATPRKLRLFAAACCRRIWHLFPNLECRKAVEVAEGYADGTEDLEALASALAGMLSSPRGQGHADSARRAASYAVYDKQAVSRLYPSSAVGYPEYGWNTTSAACSYAIQAAVWAAQGAGGVTQAETAAQVSLLRDLFDPPPVVARAVLAWNDWMVVRLAQVAYDDRLLPGGTLDAARLAVLSDALEEAGYAGDLLDHLRGPGPHVRGCHALDLLLAKS
jgi:hypothetical protein